jgi:hypothetical protein
MCTQISDLNSISEQRSVILLQDTHAKYLYTLNSYKIPKPLTFQFRYPDMQSIYSEESNLRFDLNSGIQISPTQYPQDFRNT